MITRQTIFRVSSLALAIGLSLTAHADEIARDPLLNVNEVIVVHGEGADTEQLATTHWSINEAEIRALGAQTLDQVLKNVPGVYIRVGGDGTPRVDIRGFKTRHVTLLVNGVPMSSADDGQFDPSVIPTSQIASVEVSVGPTSVLYGPSGAGGVINIITKQGSTAPALSGRVEAGKDNTFNGDISAAGSGDDWQGLVSVSRQQTDGFPMSNDFEPTKYQDGELRANSDKEVTNVYAQGSYWLSDKTQLIANAALRNGEWGKPARDGTGSGKLKYERTDDYDSHTFQLGLAHQFDDTFTLRGFGYHNQSDTLEAAYADETYLALTQTQDGRSVVQGVNLQLITDFHKAGLLTTSVIAEEQSWKSVVDTYSSNTGSGTGNNSGTGSGSGGGTGSGGGSGGAENLNDSAWLYTAAAEYQYQSEHNYGVTLGGAFHSLDASDGTDDNYSAMASSYWQVVPDSRLSLSVARKVRFPSMVNLYSQSSGNRDLEAEESKHVELGLEQNLPASTDFSLYGYYTDAKNYIAKDTAGFYQNMGRYEFKGIDFQINNHVIEHLDLSFSYSYLDSKEMEGDDTLDALQYRPRHQLRWQMSYEFPFETQVHLNVERILDQVYATQVKVNGQNQYQQQSLDNYTLVDINLVQPLITDKLDVYLRATNLLDENYYQSEALPQAGRQFFVGVNWQI
ncbi:TonB-dependent receptor [Shewanella sp. LC6]|uniref:TonB-dependent receptor plug domain-containing protein n=1 Tax=unclassified Shewanella TaxID=196818 RepID=UPI0011295754|nr:MULTISPECIES: TonB-dependent receptor [unclassified Shewanella]QQK62000.1 TonB-dependent receptor [Shewanella sp. LC6]TPE47033.1 TonB-dependent receptor [Shewanella sp. LC2]